MRFVVIFLILFQLGISASAQVLKAPAASDKEWLRKELLRIGLSKSFTEESLKHYEPKGFNTVVTLNLLGFLQPSGAHTTQVTPKAVQRATNFIKENEHAFKQANTKYSVPPDVISSLLWIETRHGEDLGTFHTVSVYLHLLQANRNENRQTLTKLAIKKNKEVARFTNKDIRRIMKDRTKKKSQWAQEQLIALASIRKNKHLNIKKLRGSYAGAFGLPQFIPSSYRDFAVAQKPSAVPNLTNPADAIMSVANYLSESGWQNKDPNSHVTALMKYNNSRDYADGILEISKRLPANVIKPKDREASAASADGT